MCKLRVTTENKVSINFYGINVMSWLSGEAQGLSFLLLPYYAYVSSEESTTWQDSSDASLIFDKVTAHISPSAE